jgi:hypothetical protein
VRVIPAPGRRKQEDLEFKASLGYLGKETLVSKESNDRGMEGGVNFSQLFSPVFVYWRD